MKASLVKPNYTNWIKRKVSITDLFLDLENIRLELDTSSSPSQEALINDLFLNENAMQILESIAINGFFPDELPVAIFENKKLIVIDGNRRLAALKVMMRPEIVPSKETNIKQLLKKTTNWPKQLDVVIAPSRDDVRHFLASKHTQNTKRPWRRLRQAYFYKAELQRGKTVQNLRREYPGVDITKFLRLINVHRIAKSLTYDTDNIAKKVHGERSFPTSTIERLYDSKQARDFLGFDFDKDGELKIKIKKNEFEKGFKKVIQDAVEKIIDTRVLNNENKITDYLKSFTKFEVPIKVKSTTELTSKSFTEKIIQTIARRTKLAPKDISFSLQKPGVRKMLNELQSIDYHKFPNATHDLLRSFLECSLKSYYEYKKIYIKPKRDPFIYLSDVLQEFKKEMDSKKNHGLSQLTQKIISDTTMQSYSTQFLDAKNHNPNIFADPKDVETAWDKLEPLFRYILDPK